MMVLFHWPIIDDVPSSMAIYGGVQTEGTTKIIHLNGWFTVFRCEPSILGGTPIYGKPQLSGNVPLPKLCHLQGTVRGLSCWT